MNRQIIITEETLFLLLIMTTIILIIGVILEGTIVAIMYSEQFIILKLIP